MGDDPAFFVVLVLFLVVASISYGCALQVSGMAYLHILCLFIGLHFVLAGAVIATFSWFFSNQYLRSQPFQGGMEQRMEWMYAFDIHCNSFFPLFLALYVVHYFLLPFLIQDTWTATILSNSIYGGALSYYSYIMSLG